MMYNISVTYKDGFVSDYVYHDETLAKLHMEMLTSKMASGEITKYTWTVETVTKHPSPMWNSHMDDIIVYDDSDEITYGNW